MRIAVAAWTSKCVGGVEAYLSLVVPALRAGGHDVAFWYEHDHAGSEPDIALGDGTVVWSAARTGARAALQALRDWRPDVLYVNGLHDDDLERQLLQIAPAVLFVHTYIGTCISGTKTHTRPHAAACDKRFGTACLVHYMPRGCGGSSPATMVRLYRAQSRRLSLMGQYRAVLTHSTHMQRELGRHDVAASVVPFPVSSAPGSQSLERGSAVRLLFAGRMDALKGGEYLLDAAPGVRGVLGRPLQVTLAGDGRDRSAWERRARAVEAADPAIRIEFTGWKSPAELDRLMAGTDLLVVPSVWPEPFGSVGPAAAQHGVPAAAFAVGGIPEWLHDGVSGHLAAAAPPTASALARAITGCLGDPMHYAMLSRGAREVGSRFTLDRHLPLLVDALERAA